MLCIRKFVNHFSRQNHALAVSQPTRTNTHILTTLPHTACVLQSKLPQEAVNMLNSLIPPAPSSVSSASFTSYSTSFSSSSSMDPVDVTPEPVNSTTTTTSTAPNAPTTIYGQQDVMATQAGQWWRGAGSVGAVAAAEV